MILLLDTTYLFPFIKVEISGIDSKFLNSLRVKTDLVLRFCNISLFELAAKGIKLIIENQNLKYKDIQTGLDTLLYSSEFKSINWVSNPYIIELSYEMRKIHKDFIDCIILSTAIITSDAIATFDTTLFNIIEKSPILVKKIQQMNPNFEFWFHDFSEPPKKLIYKK